MKTFNTPKGTELPLLNLRGKDYLQVAHRIVWFREEKPNWRIQTQIHFTDDKQSIVRATILDENGNIMAQGTKSETFAGFPDHLEKAETGSIGRALALCGFGTQFAPEFDEVDRLADSPLPSKAPKSAPVTRSTTQTGPYIIPFGKFKGKGLGEVNAEDLKSYAEYIRNTAEKENKPINDTVHELLERIDAL
jgi:hypothetical protein